MKRVCARTTMSTLLSALVLFLLSVDITSPPAKLPEAVDGADLLGLIFDRVWRLSQPQQVLLAAAATPATIMWSSFWLRLTFGQDRCKSSAEAWSAAGLLVALAGWALRQWAKVELADKFQYQIAAPASLMSGGPYAWLVHPGYMGSYFHVTGATMLLAAGCGQRRAPLTVAVLALAVAVQGRIRIAPEEGLLQAQFGDMWTAHVQSRWRLLAYAV